MASKQESKRIKLDDLPSSRLAQILMQAQMYRPPVSQVQPVNDVGQGISVGVNALLGAVQQNRQNAQMQQMMSQQAAREQAMMQQQMQAEQQARREVAQANAMAYKAAGLPDDLAYSAAAGDLDPSVMNTLLNNTYGSIANQQFLTNLKGLYPKASDAQLRILMGTPQGQQLISEAQGKRFNLAQMAKELGGADVSDPVVASAMNYLMPGAGVPVQNQYQQAQMQAQTGETLANTNKINTDVWRTYQLTPTEVAQNTANTANINARTQGQNIDNYYRPGLFENQTLEGQLGNQLTQGDLNARAVVEQVMANPNATLAQQNNAMSLYSGLTGKGNYGSYQQGLQSQFGTNKDTRAINTDMTKAPLAPTQAQGPVNFLGLDVGRMAQDASGPAALQTLSGFNPVLGPLLNNASANIPQGVRNIPGDIGNYLQTSVFDRLYRNYGVNR